MCSSGWGLLQRFLPDSLAPVVLHEGRPGAVCGLAAGARRPGLKGPREKLEPRRPRKRQAGGEKRKQGRSGGPFPLARHSLPKTLRFRALKLSRLSESVPDGNDKRGDFAPRSSDQKTTPNSERPGRRGPREAQLSSRPAPEPKAQHCSGKKGEAERLLLWHARASVRFTCAASSGSTAGPDCNAARAEKH